MTEKYQIYKCNICGNIVEVLHTGVGELVCCGQPMSSCAPSCAKATADKPAGASEDKSSEMADKPAYRSFSADRHIPVIEELPANDCRTKDGVLIKIGEIEHPMEKDHHIEWIEIIVEDGKRGKRFLDLDDKPESKFYTRKKILGVRVYCNIHGLWELKEK